MNVHGVLIDVHNGKISELDIEEANLDEFYSALNCSCIDITIRKIGDRVFDFVCDDEGLLKENPIVSAVSKSGEPMLVGNLFICSHNYEYLASISKDDVRHIAKHIMVSVQTDKHGNIVKAYPVVSDVSYVGS